jgi:hypothetical protein
MAMGTLMYDDTLEGVAMAGALGEGRRTLSWIWFTVSDDENSPDMHEGEQTITSLGELVTDKALVNPALRVEWAKSKVRASRWHEEVMLLEEEMRRAIVYSHW